MLLLVAAIAALLSGCIPVACLFPLYTASDRAFEPGLLGLWRDCDDPPEEGWLIVETKEDGGYKFGFSEVEEGREITLELDARLVRMEQYLFVDVRLTRIQGFDTDDLLGQVSTHLVGRVFLEADTLRMHFLDDDWVRSDLPEQYWIGASEVVVTASTPELRQIALAHAENDAAFNVDSEVCRTNLDAELVFLREVLAKSPSDEDRAIGLFWADLQRGRSDAALALAREHVRLRPTAGSAHERAGIAWLLNDDRKRALQEFEEAVRLEPKSPTANFYRGLMDFLERRYSEAEASLGAANELDPDRASTMCFLALTRQQLGKTSEAEAVLHELVQLRRSPAASLAEYLLGETTDDEVLAQVHDTGNRCAALFYLGYGALLRGESPRARELLQRSLQTQQVRLPEYLAAHGVLAQL
jgi:tetratricopeptide (TPR) repeat protein